MKIELSYLEIIRCTSLIKNKIKAEEKYIKEAPLQSLKESHQKELNEFEQMLEKFNGFIKKM